MPAKPVLGHISPFFIVDDVVRAMRFYEESLGFEIRYFTPTDSPFFAIVGRDSVQSTMRTRAAKRVVHSAGEAVARS